MKGRPVGALSRPNIVVECARRLLASSLILYMMVWIGQRAWVLLNSDIGQLIRR